MNKIVHKLIVYSLLSCPVLSYAQTLYFPHMDYNGNLQDSFPYTIISNATETTAILTGNLNILNLDNTMAATPLSCLSNPKGAMTIQGKNKNILFENLRSCANGAAISSTVSSSNTPYTITDVGTLSCINCATLSAIPSSNTPTTPQGGGIYTTVPLTLQNINTLVFQDNYAGSAGGAIYSTQTNLTNIKKTALFSNNTATTGGALCSSTGISISNCASVHMKTNSATTLGGALYAADSASTPTTDATISLSGNTEIKLTNNTARCGGAIYGSGNVTLSNNTRLIVKDNAAAPEIALTASDTSAGKGGAIFTKPTTSSSAATYTGVTLTNQGEMLFANNNAAVAGGAIFTDKLAISSSGPTAFINNISASGGAISIAESGTLQLSADQGDMIFYRNYNKNITAANTPPTLTRNSISLGKGASISSLSASQHHNLIFYDPITSSLPDDTASTTNVTINPTPTSRASTTYGSVVFSGFGATGDSLATTIYQPMTLDNGKLVLQKSASLATVSFTQQNTSSTLLVDGDVTLKITENSHTTTPPPPAPPAGGGGGGSDGGAGGVSPGGSSGGSQGGDAGNSGPSSRAAAAADSRIPAANANGAITIKNLHINLSSLTPTSTGAQIKTENATGTITLSGPIVLEDTERHNIYENHALFNQNTVTFTPLVLSVKTGGSNTGTITVTDVPTGSQAENGSHYGYQGMWIFNFIDGPTGGDTTTKTLQAIWGKTGFTPNPERIGTVVPNSLWGSIFDLRALNALITTNCDGFGYCRGLWASALSTLFYHDRENSPRFRRVSGGYAVGATSQTMSGTVFGMAFSQTFGRAKDYVVSHTTSQALSGSGFLSLEHVFNSHASVKFAGRVNYSHTYEDIKTRYTFAPATDGSWHSNAWLGEVGLSLPLIPCHPKLHMFTITPFANAQFGYATHCAFKEKSNEGRSFHSDYLLNLSIPVGIKIDRRSHEHPDFYSVAFSYVPDAYRRNPSGKAVLLINNASWHVPAMRLERDALLIQGSSHTALNNNIEIFTHGGCELRKDSQNYTVDIGSKFRF